MCIEAYLMYASKSEVHKRDEQKKLLTALTTNKAKEISHLHKKSHLKTKTFTITFPIRLI